MSNREDELIVTLLKIVERAGKEQRNNPGISDDLFDEIIDWDDILDAVGTPKDNSAEEPHVSHSQNPCPTCFCRDGFYSLIAELQDGKISIQKFLKKHKEYIRECDRSKREKQCPK